MAFNWQPYRGDGFRASAGLVIVDVWEEPGQWVLESEAVGIDELILAATDADAARSEAERLAIPALRSRAAALLEAAAKLEAEVA